MILAMGLALGGGLLAFLIRGQYFVRPIYLRRVINEGDPEPWWMAPGWPRTMASKWVVVIIPFHWVTMGWWRMCYWFRNKPVEMLWPFFGEDYNEIRRLREQNRVLKMAANYHKYTTQINPGAVEYVWSQKFWTGG